MPKLVIWDESTTGSEVTRRFINAGDARQSNEMAWRYSEDILYNINNTINRGQYEEEQYGVDAAGVRTNASYIFKNLRFIHAQMSANPPAVVIRPATSDQEDQRRSDAADKIARYALRRYKMQEKIDRLTLNTLIYGTGVIKVIWDSSSGDIISYDRKSGELETEGDIKIATPHTWNIYLDPDARTLDEVKWVIEEIYMDYDEAVAKWPNRKEELTGARVSNPNSGTRSGNNSGMGHQTYYNSVKLLEYWETGLPSNGYLGRYCVTTDKGHVIEECRPSPHRFKQPGALYELEMRDDLSEEEKVELYERIPEQARLPYHILTDIDVTNSVWGKSFVEYTAHLQSILNRTDSATLENIQAHSSPKLVIPESADVDDTLTNSPWDVYKISGNQPPYYMNMPSLMPDGMARYRLDLLNGINDISGVNEAMMGQMSRETAGTAMQFATSQGNAIRRRLFNKYQMAVESIYQDILDLVRKHWSTARTVNVIGKEDALQAMDIRGIDVDGGYDIVAEYGTAFSLDPITRRQELLMLQPLFKEAGIPTRRILSLLKLSELETAYDELQLAESRQREIFESMISTGEYISPKAFRDHENMVAYALRYFMTAEFESLAPELQELCERHIQDRVKLAAMEKQGMVGGETAQIAEQVATTPGPVPTEPAQVPGTQTPM